jgi:hypothetical protein
MAAVTDRAVTSRANMTGRRFGSNAEADGRIAT